MIRAKYGFKLILPEQTVLDSDRNVDIPKTIHNHLHSLFGDIIPEGVQQENKQPGNHFYDNTIHIENHVRSLTIHIKGTKITFPHLSCALATRMQCMQKCGMEHDIHMVE